MSSTLVGQQTTTPAISDSPTAQTLFDDIRSQAKENPSQSARLARRLLDEYGHRVVRVGAESDDLFTSVAAQTEQFLLAHPIVLARFREMESRAAERMLREEGAGPTAARRRLTAAGLSATLMLAQESVRADRPLEALAMLALVVGHPDLLGTEAASHATLESMARLRLGDAAGSETALARLAALPGIDAEFLARARAAAARTARATGAGIGRSPMATSPDGGDPDETWRQIWALDLDQSLFHRIFGGVFSARQQRDVDRARSDGSFMTAVPTVLGNQIFVCEGHRVRAVDIDSRDERWAREIGSLGLERESGAVADLSAIAVDEGVLVVYEGHAFANGRSATARVWCLDPQTGATEWSTVVDGCDGRTDLAGLFPVGTPLLVSDVVIVAARKPTQRLEQVDWLLALDRRDGSLRWATSIAGAPGNRGAIGRKNAGLATDGSMVIDATPLGVVVSVRANDGAIEWLRRFPVPLREPRYLAEPWEAGSPAICGDRIVALTPDELEIVSLERDSGRLLEAKPIGPDTAWMSPNYLISATAEDGTALVLGVGSNITAFAARDLGKRLWTLSEATAEITPPRVGIATRNGVRGRVSVAGQYVVVPGVEEILLLDLNTGRLKARIPSERPCNPLLLSDRIVAAGDEALRVIMPSERAEAMLRARLAAAPDDPSAAIALLELAQATGRPEVALDAARTAQGSLLRGRGSPSLRGELIDKLVLLAEQHPAKGDEVYAIVSKVSDTPMLRVRGEIARGEFLRTAGRASDAVQCWRALAADPLLCTQLIGLEETGRQVRLEALGRIAQLSSRDRDIAGELESAARSAAQRLGANPSQNAVAAILRAHPRTVASIDAMAAATNLELAPFLTLANAAIGDCLVPPARVELIDALRAEMTRRGVLARDRAAIDDRIADLLIASGVDRAAWRSAPTKRAQLGTTAVSGMDLRPRLVVETAPSREGRDPELVFGLHDGALVRMSGPVLATQWRLRLDDREPILLWANKRAVLWQTIPTGGRNNGEDNAIIVDVEAGSVIYASPRGSEIWPGPANQAEPPRLRQGGLGEGAPQPRVPTMPTLVVPACDGESLVLARRNGDIARIGVMDEKPAPIIARQVLDQVFSESLHDGLLTLGGRETVGETTRTVVVVLDARTLQRRARIEPVTASDVKWAFATALGEIFIGTHAGVERWTTGFDGESLPTLASQSSESSGSHQPFLLGGHLFTLDSSERPILTPLFAGAPRTFIYPDSPDARELRDIHQLPEGLLLQADDRFTLLGRQGEAIGLDSTSREANLAFGIPVDGAVLQVNALEPDTEAGKLRYQIGCVIERLDPSKGLRNEGRPFEVKSRDSRVNRVLAANGWLLLSNSQGTMAVSMPINPEGAALPPESPPGSGGGAPRDPKVAPPTP